MHGARVPPELLQDFSRTLPGLLLAPPVLQQDYFGVGQNWALVTYVKPC